MKTRIPGLSLRRRRHPGQGRGMIKGMVQMNLEQVVMKFLIQDDGEGHASPYAQSWDGSWSTGPLIP